MVDTAMAASLSQPARTTLPAPACKAAQPICVLFGPALGRFLTCSLFFSSLDLEIRKGVEVLKDPISIFLLKSFLNKRIESTNCPVPMGWALPWTLSE